VRYAGFVRAQGDLKRDLALAPQQPVGCGTEAMIRSTFTVLRAVGSGRYGRAHIAVWNRVLLREIENAVDKGYTHLQKHILRKLIV
jgi:hypothetical protein